MKKIILSAVLLCTAVTFSMAQDRTQGNRNRNPEDMAKRMIEHLDKELTLSPVQKDSISKWSQSFSKKQQELFKNEGESREARMEKMRVIRDEQTSKIKSILTAEQKVKYEAMTKRNEAQRNQRGEGQEGGRRQRN